MDNEEYNGNEEFKIPVISKAEFMAEIEELVEQYSEVINIEE